MDKEILYSGKYIHFCRKKQWEYVIRNNCTGITVILPVTENREIILVEQYRIPVDKNVISFPAGLAGDTDDVNESLEQSAQRELKEETGYCADKLTRLVDSPPSPGLCSEILTFFLATGLKKCDVGGGDETEAITVHLVQLDFIESWLNHKCSHENMLIDTKVYAGLYLISNSHFGQLLVFNRAVL